uniref:Terpene synthase N-terminal domain-containing protein n=1 Tax=Oryza glumipatula TaxID=40148 RepID=A0A0D9ZJ63_9ORYZ
MRQRVDNLREKVCTLFRTSGDVVARMKLVDSIQRLGVGHLFNEEISTTLSDIHASEFTSSSLYEVALRFRLLREHGLWVSPATFNIFKGDDGRFINEIADEPSAYLLVHDEPELEEAISFSRHHLKSMMQCGNLKHPLADQVKRALHLPLPRTYKRVETLHYLSEYGQEEGHISFLLDLAKVDFNILQGVHLKELKAISEYGISLIYTHQGSFGGELHMVPNVVLQGRISTHTDNFYQDNCMDGYMDDTYDSHATIQECRKLNEAIQRWDESAVFLLPEYLKKFYNELLNNFKEFEDQVTINDKYRVAYAKKERSETCMQERAEKLKGDIRTLFGTCNDMSARMNLVDSIQHLGVVHLFQEQIQDALMSIHESEFRSSSLHEVALRFRLLREHGFWVPPDAFNKFKGDDGRFRNEIANDPRGLLSLYNAAHLLIHGEPELEEAISFAREHLKLMSQDNVLNPPLACQVRRALTLPLPRTFKRVETICYMLEYQLEEGNIPILLDLARLDFNLLQHIHLKELKAISEWWKDLYGYMGLSYIRDRIIEGYTWSYMMFYEEGFAFTRIFVAKLIALVTVMDDTYDAHATIEECHQLNTAIQRWDKSAISILPDYLKKYYSKLLINFKEFEDQVTDNQKYMFQKQSTYYLQEAEWSNQKYKPGFKDQVVLSTKSSAVQLLCVAAMVGWGGTMTTEAFEWRGKNKGDVASSVECYMNESGVTSEVAFAKINALVEDEWRSINQTRLEHRTLLPMVQRIVNFTVSMVLFYDDRKDAYTFGTLLREIVESLFVNPVPI